MRLYVTLLFFALTYVYSGSAQNSKSTTLRNEFSRFDANKSGWLSGTEVIACRCKLFDSNSDNEITIEEYFMGRGSLETPEANPSPALNVLGAKVIFPGSDGKIYTGIILAQKADTYKIKYDGYDFEAWLTRSQFSFQSGQANGLSETRSNRVTNVNEYTPITNVYSIFNFGKKNGWASQMQETRLNAYLSGLTEKEKTNLTDFLNQGTTSSAKFFVLKSLLAGDDFNTLQRFITQLNKYPETYQQEKCLVTMSSSIIQQWQYSCSVTTVQTYLGDLCPRYAWEVKQISNFDAVANDPSHPMAQQQKELLERYGGIASARGDYSGKAIGINGPLNDLVGKVLGVTFYAQEVNEPIGAVLTKIRSQLDRGIGVPMLIGFEGVEGKHFVLVMKYKNQGGLFYYMVYDPWEGKSAYVSQTNLISGSMAPLQQALKISIDYFYPTYE